MVIVMMLVVVVMMTTAFLCWLRSSMAHSARRDSPELPDFSLLKRLARDQLIYLLEQVRASLPPRDII